MKGRKTGFTLIEILVVIAITASMLGLVLPNYLGARERVRDTKVKAEMDQLKNALRVYYNDYQQYPASSFNKIAGCKVGGIGECPCSAAVDFAVSTDEDCNTVTTVYMKKFPAERTFGTDTTKYYASGDGEKFCIVTTLENASDPDLAKSQARCTSFCAWTDAEILTSSYVVCSY